MSLFLGKKKFLNFVPQMGPLQATWDTMLCGVASVYVDDHFSLHKMGSIMERRPIL